MSKLQIERYELLVTLSEEPTLEKMEKALAPHFAHFARGKSKRRKSYKVFQGKYIIVATRANALKEICAVLDSFKVEFVILGGHVSHPNSPEETFFASLFTLAAGHH